MRAGSDSRPDHVRCMTQRPPVRGSGHCQPMTDQPSRQRLTRLAVWACGVSVAWALAVGVAAISVGAAAGSLALVAFGLDSLVDGSASAVLVWRFGVEGRYPERAHRVEALAQRFIGAALLLAAAYVASQAIIDLAHRSGPQRSVLGVSLAAASVVALPILGFLKLGLARRLGSSALRGDGVLTAAGAALAAATLIGLVLADTFSWRWADPGAALVIAVVLAVEGLRPRSVTSSSRPRPGQDRR